MFKKNRPNTATYLKLFLNLGKGEYSSSEKERLVESFTLIIKRAFPDGKVKYDITGRGYGISKGGPALGMKAFKSRFEKKGYDKMYGVSGFDENHQFQTGLSILPKRDSDFCSFYIVAPLILRSQEELVEVVLSVLAKFSSIDYGYGYSVGNNYDGVAEDYERRGLFSTSVRFSKERYDFEHKAKLCLEGKINRITEINILNQKQSQLIRSAGISGIKTIGDIEYLLVDIKDIRQVQKIAQSLYV